MTLIMADGKTCPCFVTMKDTMSMDSLQGILVYIISVWGYEPHVNDARRNVEITRHTKEM